MKNVHSRPYFWVISRVLRLYLPWVRENFQYPGCAKICPRENFQISRSQSARKFVRAKIYTNKVFTLHFWPKLGSWLKIVKNYRFSHSRNIYDGHIWLSVYTRPLQSSFTTVQRLCACFTLLLTSMLANAMFYRGGEVTTLHIVFTRAMVVCQLWTT